MPLLEDEREALRKLYKVISLPETYLEYFNLKDDEKIYCISRYSLSANGINENNLTDEYLLEKSFSNEIDYKEISQEGFKNQFLYDILEQFRMSTYWYTGSSLYERSFYDEDSNVAYAGDFISRNMPSLIKEIDQNAFELGLSDMQISYRYNNIPKYQYAESPGKLLFQINFELAVELVTNLMEKRVIEQINRANNFSINKFFRAGSNFYVKRRKEENE